MPYRCANTWGKLEAIRLSGQGQAGKATHYRIVLLWHARPSKATGTESSAQELQCGGACPVTALSGDDNNLESSVMRLSNSEYWNH